ncbi:DNA methyltransferase [Flavobacterium sp.]
MIDIRKQAKNYNDFIESKILEVPNTGFEYNNFHENTFPHQRDVCQWALHGGRRAIFCSFGLGKTVIQLEIAKAVIEKTGKPFLIGLPLGVLGEFRDDAKTILGLEVDYVVDQADAEHAQSFYDKPQIMLSNYDRIREGKFDTSYFGGVSFDEGDAIRNLETKTSDYIINEMSKINYRFIATATPAPNEFTEILNYAQFLGVCDRGQALTRFFQRDSTSAGNLTLYPHKEKEFWLWVRSWAIFIEYPSDLGYSDEGYRLPELKVHYHQINLEERSIKSDRDGNFKMFTDASKSLSEAAKEKRESLFARAEKSVEIAMENPDRHFIFWHDLEDERKALELLLPKDKTKSVFGSQKQEIKEQYLNEFKHGQYQYLATKPSIAGAGCNFQKHCSDAVFTGIGYKFKDFIQAIHRILRFRQFNQVNIHLVFTDAELEILKTLERKWSDHKKMIAEMTALMKKYGLDHRAQIAELKRAMEIERQEWKGKNATLINNDCVLEVKNFKDNSIKMILTSIPFSDQYEYCENYRDFGHNDGDKGFFEQMDFLVPELLRVLEPGRICAIHVKNRIQFSYQNGVGFTSLKPFRSKVEDCFMQHGFWLLGEHYIPTDVVRENNQTYRLGWTENCKDGTKMGAGSPEYLLIFRKAPTDISNAYADDKVVKSKDDYTRGRWQLDAHSLWKTSGNRLLTPEELRTLNLSQIGKRWKEYCQNNPYDFEAHVELCETLDSIKKLPSSFMAVSPWTHTQNDFVWDDINRMNTLNTQQASKRKMLHVCPLQFDIVDRAIDRYSNPGDLIYDPFCGIGTVPLRAIKKGRKGIGTELFDLYWKDSVEYLKAEEYKESVPTLFDTLETA